MIPEYISCFINFNFLCINLVLIKTAPIVGEGTHASFPVYVRCRGPLGDGIKIKIVVNFSE